VPTFKLGPHARQKICFYPKGYNKTLPCVLFIHGGGWTSGRPEEVSGEAPYYHNAGFHLASVGYRYATEAKWPAQIDDVRLAIPWLKGNPYVSDIIVLGASAGGLMAYWLGIDGGIKALMVLHGVAHTGADILYEPGYDRVLSSPREQVQAALCPTFISHGTADTIVPYEGAVLMKDKLVSLGTDVTFHSHNGGHVSPKLSTILTYARSQAYP
jgi:acetyl esterase/lipase